MSDETFEPVKPVKSSTGPEVQRCKFLHETQLLASNVRIYGSGYYFVSTVLALNARNYKITVISSPTRYVHGVTGHVARGQQRVTCIPAQ